METSPKIIKYKSTIYRDEVAPFVYHSSDTVLVIGRDEPEVGKERPKYHDRNKTPDAMHAISARMTRARWRYHPHGLTALYVLLPDSSAATANENFIRAGDRYEVRGKPRHLHG